MIQPSQKNEIAKKNILEYLKAQTGMVKIIATKNSEVITGIDAKNSSNLMNRMVKQGYLSIIKRGVFALRAEKPTVSKNTQPASPELLERMAKMRAAKGAVKESEKPKGKLKGFKLIKLYPGCKYLIGYFEPLSTISEKLSNFPELWRPVYEQPKVELTEQNKIQIKEAIDYMEVALAILKKAI